MARIYAAADGTLLAVRRTLDEERLNGDAPPGTASTLELDAATNAATLQTVIDEWNSHRLLAGILSRNGVPYVIAADSEAETVRKAAAQTVADLTTYLGLASPTNAQNVLALKTLARAMRYLIRREFGLT